jgi:hypothetical protein
MMKHFYTDPNGVTHTWETPDIHTPLDTNGVIATLNAVLGLWTLEDAANAVSLTENDLIAEAEAWAVGGTNPVEEPATEEPATEEAPTEEPATEEAPTE